MSIPATLCKACRLPATGSLARGAVAVIRSIICAAAPAANTDGGGEVVPVPAVPGSFDAGFSASLKRTLTNSDHPHGVELLSSALVRYDGRKVTLSSDSAIAGEDGVV